MCDTVRRLDISPSRLFAGMHDGESMMLCPVCQCDYTHPIGACTRVGRDEWEAGVYQGTEAIGITGHRRSALVVLFRCEYGHRFALVIQQHKGQNFCSVEQWPDVLLDQFAEEWSAGARQAQKRLQELKKAPA